jgi:hypothetical protein
MSFGLTLNGFVPERLSDIVTALNADFQTQFGQNVKLDPTSVNGQLIGVMAERFADLWEAVQEVYAASYVNTARGQALDDIFLLVGLTRNPATSSLVTLTLTTSATVAQGSTVQDASGNVWTTLSAAVPAGGTATTTASPSITGPIPALAGSLTIINSPVTGWTAVTNAHDAVLGTNVESDAQFVTRGLLAARYGAGSSVDALRASLLRSSGVQLARVIENTSALIDSVGRPGHSIECVVQGSGVVQQDILNRIWAGKPGGCLTYGNTSGTVIDAAGNTQNVNYTIPVVVPIYLTIQYWVLGANQGPQFPAAGVSQIQSAILAYGQTLNAGQIVAPWPIEQSFSSVPGLEEVQIFLGTGYNPTNQNPISIPLNQLAAFDSTRLVIQRMN